MRVASTYIEVALRGRTTARPPLVNDSLLKINALGRCGPTSLADFGTLTWLEVGCLEALWKHLEAKGAILMHAKVCTRHRAVCLMTKLHENDEKSKQKR